ncbi:MAG: flippase-like domain-containing protein [Deltaproteobacteria bacterium]|nr:flippase-like domain-containing protein [Deltaproteobacteria bacterium]
MVVLIVGLVAFALLFRGLGWSATKGAVVGAGWWFAAIAAIDLASVLCDAGGIYSFVSAKVDVSYWRVFAAQASGLAINRLTPGNSLGEPTKMTMLAGHVPESLAIAGVVMFNIAQYYIAFAAIVIGVPVTLLMIELPATAQLAVWIATGAIVIVAVGAAIVIRRGAIGSLIAALTRLHLVGPARAARWTARIAEIDEHVKRVGDSRASSTRNGVGLIFLSRCLNWAGTIAVLLASKIPLTAVLVVAMMSAGILLTWLSNVIPLGLGIADGGNYALYGLLGASPQAGLVFSMVNRVRTVVLAAMGLTVMAIANAVRNRQT